MAPTAEATQVTDQTQRKPGRQQLLVLVLIWVATSALYLYLQRNLFFYVDEGDWITFAGTRGVGDFLEPFNEHLIFVPLLAFRAVLEVAGSHYLAFTVIELLALASLSLALFTYARSRIDPWITLVPAVLPFFIAGGLGFTSLLMPLIGFEWFLALSLGLWALILVERRTTAADAGACALLVLALATFSVSLAFVMACFVAILFDPKRWKRIWVVALPVGLFGIWYLTFGTSETTFELSNVLWLPAYFLDSIAAVGAAILGLSLPYGPGTSLKLDGFSAKRLALFGVEAVVILLLLGWAWFTVRRRKLPWSPVVIALTVPVTMFTLQGLVLDDIRQPIDARYMIAGAVALFLPAIELFRGYRFTAVERNLILVLGLICVVIGVNKLHNGSTLQTAYATEAKAVVGAIELAGERADPTYNPAQEELTQYAAGMFFPSDRLGEFGDSFGPLGFSEDEIRRQSPEVRDAADVHFARSIRLEINRFNRNP